MSIIVFKSISSLYVFRATHGKKDKDADHQMVPEKIESSPKMKTKLSKMPIDVVPSKLKLITPEVPAKPAPTDPLPNLESPEKTSDDIQSTSSG